MEEEIRHEKTQKDINVERVDVNSDVVVYDSSITRALVIGFFAGGILFGFAAYLVSSGIAPIEGFGYFSASGIWPAIAVGFGFGSSLFALIAGLASIGKQGH